MLQADRGGGGGTAAVACGCWEIQHPEELMSQCCVCGCVCVCVCVCVRVCVSLVGRCSARSSNFKIE